MKVNKMITRCPSGTVVWSATLLRLYLKYSNEKPDKYSSEFLQLSFNTFTLLGFQCFFQDGV